MNTTTSNAWSSGASTRLKASIIGLWLVVPLLLLALSWLDVTVEGKNVSAMADDGLLIGLAFALIGLVGALAAMGQPRNAVGWILLFSSLAITLAAVAETWLNALLATGNDAEAHVAGWIGALGWYTGTGLLFLIFPFLYPDGRLPGRRWRLAIAAAVIVFATILGLTLISPFFLPTGFELPPIEALTEPVFLAVPPVLLLGVASLVVRYRQARGSVRLQMKWLLVTIGGSLIAFLTTATLEAWLGMEGGFSDVIWGLMYIMIPLSLGIALLRYRMFDVDTVIRKTVVYTVLTFLLALVYLGIVIILQRLLSPVTGESTVAVVLSTLVIAALFLPLRRRIQGLIDKRFYRQKYDAEKVLATFAATVRDETDLDALTAELLRVIQETMEPEHVSLWLKPAAARRRTTDDS